MRASIPLAAILILSALSCADSQGSADAAAKDKAVSVYTSLKTKACTEEIDPDDPNDTRYQVCPGAGGDPTSKYAQSNPGVRRSLWSRHPKSRFL